MSIKSWIVHRSIKKRRVPSVWSNEKFEISGDSNDKLMEWKFELKLRRVHDRINIILKRRNMLLNIDQVRRKENSLTKATYLVKWCGWHWTSIISFHREWTKFHWWFWAKDIHTGFRFRLMRSSDNSCLSWQRSMKKHLKWNLKGVSLSLYCPPN